MLMTKKTWIITILIVLCLFCGSASAWSGSGTQADPWKISNYQDLQRLSGSSYSSYVGNSKYFELSGNIQCSGTFTPIGNSQTPFNGHFDGKGHTIENLVINAPSPCGLFSIITSGAEIKNINFQSASITSTGYSGTGVVYGATKYARNTIMISNINVINSEIKSDLDRVGGISGDGACLTSTVKTTLCNVESSIIYSSGGTSVGGISGNSARDYGTHEMTSCNVKNCVIISDRGAGGISGDGAYYYSNARFNNCNVESCVIITSNGNNCGGIHQSGANTNSVVSDVGCHVKNCYIYGNAANVGGISGIGTITESSYEIVNCIVEKSTIRANSGYVGGILGKHVSGETNSPAISGCDIIDTTIIGANNTGGILGGV